MARKIGAVGEDLRRANSFRPSIENPGASGRRVAPFGVCGITFEKFQDIKEGDIIEAFMMEQIQV